MTKRLNYLARKNGGIEALVGVEAWLAKSFDPKLLDLVKVRVSQINGCAYCLHMHRKDAIKQGETEDRLLLLDAWRESELYTDRERAALAWAEAPTEIAENHAPDAVYEPSAERLLRGRAPRALDRRGHHQRLEQAGDRISPEASGGSHAHRDVTIRDRVGELRCATRPRLMGIKTAQ